MYPRTVDLYGVRLATWDFVLAAGVVLGYFVAVAAFHTGRDEPPPRFLLLRYLVVIYCGIIGAQLFAYAFDVKTTLLPPRGEHWLAYYLNPIRGPKTLYGAMLGIPLGAAITSVPWRRPTFVASLDRYTAMMLAVMGVARIGCLLQGCCYGVRTSMFGVVFPPGSGIYADQLAAHAIERGALALPALPTQAISALALFAMSAWCFKQLRAGRSNIFPGAVAIYSVFRLLIEFLRADPARNLYGPLSTSQWIAIAILGAYGLWRAAGGQGRGAPLFASRH